MLENIRENSSGIVAWGIALLIIITMAFFGVSSYVSQHPTAIIAEVGSRSISEDNFNYAFQNWQRSTRQRMGDNAQIDLDSDFFKMQTLDSLINQELVAEISEKENYQFGNQQLNELIRNNPEFQTAGEFDSAKFTAAISRYGSETAYKTNLKQNLSSQQVLSGIADSSFVLPNKLDEIVKLRAEKRVFDLVRFPINTYAEDLAISDEEISADYAENIADYNQEEKISVEFVRFKAGDLEAQIEVSEEDIQLAYEQEKESVLSNATREIRHILLSGDDAQSQAKDALDRLNNGESFADVSKEVSQDPGSAANGGNLGTVDRGQMVKPFEDAAFALEVGVISEPIKSQFGYHIIEVTKINAAQPKTFEEMRADLEKSERERQAEELFYEQSDLLKNLVYENSDSLQVAADELALELEKTALFSRTSGVGLAANQQVRDAAFSEDVLFNNLNSNVIEVSPTELVAIRKNEYIESKPKPLDEVKKQIKTKLSAVKAVDVVAEASDEAFTLAKESQSWGDMIEKLSLTAETQSFSFADESEGTLPLELINEVFSASLASFDGKIGKAVDTRGNAFVFQLQDITETTNDTASTLKNSSEMLSLSREGGRSIIQRYLQGKRDTVGVEINQDLL